MYVNLKDICNLLQSYPATWFKSVYVLKLATSSIYTIYTHRKYSIRTENKSEKDYFVLKLPRRCVYISISSLMWLEIQKVDFDC